MKILSNTAKNISCVCVIFAKDLHRPIIRM